MRILLLLVALTGLVAAASSSSAAQGSSPTGAVVGVVEDTSGFALDAEVSIVALKRSQPSGADGTFRFAGLRPGRYVISARRVGYYAQSKVITVADSAARVKFELVPLKYSLPPIVTAAERGGISGVIGDTAYEVIAGAKVQIVSTKREATSDSTGQFFIDAPPGRYMVRVTREGYGPKLVSVTVPSDSGRRILVWLRPGEIASRKEEWAIKELALRIAWGGLNCAGGKGRSMCSGRPAFITREDINRWGFKDVSQLASAGGMLPVDPFCEVTLANSSLKVTAWMLTPSEIEAIEVYPSRRESYAVSSDMARSGARPTSKAPKFSKEDCPPIFVWVRKG
jgi:uncharacterized protein (DUF2141 family)